MTTELKTIAKQVALLNRLIELLRMQEEPTGRDLWELCGWQPCFGKMALQKHDAKGRHAGYVEATTEEAWNHPVTQKAWSDELVQVAREYLQTFTDSDEYCTEEHFVRVYGVKTIPDLVYEICKGISMETLPSKLEAILNKYGRSLKE